MDTSPTNVDGKINTKENLSRTLASTFRIAKIYKQDIIYFDNEEKIFAAKAKNAIKNATTQKMKKYVASIVTEKIGAIQEKYNKLLSGNELDKILDEGMKKTNELAKKKYELMKEKMGVIR